MAIFKAPRMQFCGPRWYTLVAECPYICIYTFHFSALHWLIWSLKGYRTVYYSPRESCIVYSLNYKMLPYNIMYNTIIKLLHLESQKLHDCLPKTLLTGQKWTCKLLRCLYDKRFLFKPCLHKPNLLPKWKHFWKWKEELINTCTRTPGKI